MHPELETREEEIVQPLAVCADLDSDCADVPCKTTCWLYQPERGICPYLNAVLFDDQ